MMKAAVDTRETADSCGELLFLTYEFPYGKSETFIETEISYLVGVYSTVWILPSRSIWSKKWLNSVKQSPRPLPKGCKVLIAETGWLDVVYSIPLFLKLLGKIDARGVFKYPRLGFIKYVFQETIKAGLIASALKKLKINLTGVRMAYSYWKSPAATGLALARNRKWMPAFVCRCHGGDLYNDRAPFPYRPFDKYLTRKLDCLFPVSAHGADYLVDNGFSKDIVQISRLGISLPKQLSQTSVDGIFRIVSCSNLIPLKQVDMIAAALTHLNRPFLWVHFGDGAERKKIEEIVKRFPSHGKAIFFGRVTNDEVLSYYRENSVDAFVNVSLSEGLPVSVMEAMAAGVPCIATDVGGTSELVDANCGLLIPSNIQVDSLSEILNSVAGQHVAWAEKRSFARKKAEMDCDAAVNFSAFCKRLGALAIH